MIFSLLRRTSPKRPFIVKSAGGAASQCLALQNALRVSISTGRPFILKHFPYSTGGYWPLAIQELLDPDEISVSFGKTLGLAGKIEADLKIGSPIPNHPLSRKGLSYEKILFFLKKSGVFSFLNTIKCVVRSEYDLRNSLVRLESVPSGMKFLTGGYVPIDHADVHVELASRFQRSGLPSPYVSSSTISHSTVIHYRLGDKRVNFENPRFKSGGILDPQSLAQMLPDRLSSNLFVVSDEPEAALDLLKSVGVHGQAPTSGNNLWEDLKIMTNSGLMICTWSTVSQLAATIRSFQNKITYYPSKDPGTNSIALWSLRCVKYYEPIFLDKYHGVYTKEIYHPEKRNQIYKKNPI